MFFSKRCDTKLNCEDGSDESGCNYVVFNDQYVKEIAPIDRDQNNLNVFFNVSILDIPYIDTYEMKLTVSFVLNLRWQDFRLMFQNLNENSDLNSLSKEDRDALWKPNIVIDNALGKGGIEYNDRTISKVITQSSPNPEVKHYATEGISKISLFL